MKKDNASDTTKTAEKPICGIIMPISECVSNGVTYTASHWESMRSFLEDAICEAGYEPKPVWEGLDQSVIHARIVNNIDEFPLMICVICGSNVNVMIELGLRLMTNKPIFVIYDENTPLPFDVNVLEVFPIALNPDYKDYQILKKEIKKVLPTMLEPNYKSFLSNFKTITPKGISGTEQVELSQFMNETREAIQSIQTQITMLGAQREKDNFDLATMRFRAFPDKKSQQEITDRELPISQYKTRLADLKSKLEHMSDGRLFSSRYLSLLLDELKIIQTGLRRDGIEDFPPIKREIVRIRAIIEMLKCQHQQDG